jgi:cysteinyl-tRNA synthetase
MHNEMLQVEGKKMSKSLGNFFSVRELLDQGYPGEVIRFVFLSTHYSKPMDWTAEKAATAKVHLDHWYAAVGDVEPYKDQSEIQSSLEEFGVLKAISNDLNTNLAIHEMYKRLELFGLNDDVEYKRAFKTAANFLGFLKQTGTQWILDTSVGFDLRGVVQKIVDRMDKARADKDYNKADYLRAALAAGRVKVMTTAEGTNWSFEPFFGDDIFDEFPDEAVQNGHKCGLDQNPATFLLRVHDWRLD